MSLLTGEDYVVLTGGTDEPSSQIQALCEAASDAVERYIGRPIEKAERTEYYAANGQKAIVLRVRPVWEIEEVRWDALGQYGEGADKFNSDTLLVAGTDYTWTKTTTTGSDRNNAGLLIRIPGEWFERPRYRDRHKLSIDNIPSYGDIRVIYTAGYDPIPASIKLACAQVVTRVKQNLERGGNLIMERLGDHKYELADKDFVGHPELGAVRQLLSRFRDPPW